MKFWIQLLLLAVIDFVLISFWVKQGNPDPGVSIGLVLLMPLVIVINLIVALIR
jgi:hypothetical protein